MVKIIKNRDNLPRFEYLLSDYFEGTTKIPELPTVAWFADKLHLSPNYFGDLIKREVGISAQEYIQQQIIERAKYLLVDKQMSVSQTAYSLGYKYPNHLSRVFKRVTGISPNEFKLNN